MRDEPRAAFVQSALISVARPGGVEALEQSEFLVALDDREDESFQTVDRSTVYRDAAYRLVEVGEREVVLPVARSDTAD